MDTILSIEQVSFSYPPARRGGDARRALTDVSFSVQSGEMIGLLGPNGGGKSTLFRILATSARPASGRVLAFGQDIATHPNALRARMGVVFQSPALDAYLTVGENLTHHGHLYGWSGARLRKRMTELAGRFGLGDRLKDRVGTLSGGLKRRVELAKALLPEPELLLCDEASTGLDPVARFQWRQQLDQLRRESSLTILMTTHFMEEAEACDRVGLLDQGRLVALGAPEALKAELGGEVLWVESPDPSRLAALLQDRFGLASKSMDGRLRLEQHPGPAFLPELVKTGGDLVSAVRLGRPTLEDVFVQRTGHTFES